MTDLARLVYFQEGAGAMSAERAEALGLGYALPTVAHRAIKGPGGASGVAFCTSASRPGPMPRWEPYPGKPGLWIGWDPEAPPGPAELARADQHAGHPVRLADGSSWVVPVARHPSGASPFPRAMKWSEGGWHVGAEPADKLHLRLWEAACDFWDRLVTAAGPEEEAEVTLDEQADLAAAALSVNYRVSPFELGALGLVTTSTVADVCLALVDFPSLRKLVEESSDPKPEGPTPERGPEESSLATSQPSPSWP